MKTPLLIGAILLGFAVQPALADGTGGPRGERPSFDALDTDGDGGLSPDELRAPFEARFAAVDTDGDGGLSEAEMAAALDAQRADRLSRLFARRDIDGDGLLQLDEMGPGPERAGAMFDRIDTDGDGVISAAEFAELGPRIGAPRFGPFGGDRG